MTRPERWKAATLEATPATRRVMLYSHDTYGLGHLRRNLRIAGHLVASIPGLQVVLVSGSPVADRFPTPPGMTVVKLPPVRKVGAEQYRPLHSGIDLSLVRRTRTAIMVDVVRRFRPDVLLVDHSPAGMNGELLGVFSAVEKHSPSTRVVLGLRDVLDDPETVVRTWTEQGIYSLLASVYDQVIVYGSRELFDVGTEYRLPAPLADRLSYAGYIAPANSGVSPSALEAGSKERYLLATAGGGGDGVAVLAAAMEAGETLHLNTKVVTGPLIDDDAFASLLSRAEGLPGVEVVKFHPQLQQAMAEAAAVVTMGGYNSLCEAISVRVPTVVIPRSQPRMEQTIRAHLFAERGLVSVVPAGPDLGERLARTVAANIGRSPVGQPLDMDGLDRLGRLLAVGDAADTLEAQRSGRRRPGPLSERQPA